MSLFRRRERPDTGPSYAEEESNPELLAAERAVNQMPSVPMVGGVTGVILGQQPQIVGVPDDLDPLEPDDLDPLEEDLDQPEDDLDPLGEDEGAEES
jgi:hypothetical protein